jgi:hypothetical protein
MAPCAGGSPGEAALKTLTSLNNETLNAWTMIVAAALACLYYDLSRCAPFPGHTVDMQLPQLHSSGMVVLLYFVPLCNITLWCCLSYLKPLCARLQRLCLLVFGLVCAFMPLQVTLLVAVLVKSFATSEGGERRRPSVWRLVYRTKYDEVLGFYRGGPGSIKFLVL